MNHVTFFIVATSCLFPIVRKAIVHSQFFVIQKCTQIFSLGTFNRKYHAVHNNHPTTLMYTYAPNRSISAKACLTVYVNCVVFLLKLPHIIMIDFVSIPEGNELGN